jgi:flagellar hook-length control protein FliK
MEELAADNIDELLASGMVPPLALPAPVLLQGATVAPNVVGEQTIGDQAGGEVTGATTTQPVSSVPLPLAPVSAAGRPESQRERASPDDSLSFAAAGNSDPAAEARTGPSDASRRLVGVLLERVSSAAGQAEPQIEQRHAGQMLYSDTGALQEPARAEAGEPVRATVGSPRWASELGSKVMLMTINRQQEGSLSLTPEHLGPVEVRINVTQDGTNVWFSAQHADTRAALTDALPRLREMFGASGLELGNTGVSHEMPRQEGRHGERPGFTSVSDETPVEASPAPQIRRVRMALLDAWA